MSRLCYDSITARDIPVGVDFVAGYIDGAYRWTDADWALHPNSIKVRIAVFASTDDGHVGDVEWGDMTTAQAPIWVAMRRRAGVDPTIYCGAYQWPAVRGAFQDARVPEPHYWIAQYDNVAEPMLGAVAKQYANATFTNGHYDASIVSGRWPGVEDDMALQDEFDKFKADTENTIAAMKKAYDALYHHLHFPGGFATMTSEPLVPPGEGAKYSGSSADGSQTFWLYPGETTPRA